MRSAWGEARSGSLARGSRILVLALAAGLGWGGAMPAADDGAASVAPPAFRLSADAAARPASARSLAEQEWAGGRIGLASGEGVTVYVSRSYADPEAPRRWAEYLGELVHGAELGSLEAYIATLDEVLELCGARALGCYGNDTMISIGESVGGVTAEEVVAHEYGHHVAHHRANPPWRTTDYGTKRWATHARICARATAGEIFPGDQGSRYELNPGEAFAEAYRALVETRRGRSLFDWSLVDASFYPDARALALVEEDVLVPWTQSSTSATSARVGRGARTWTSTVATPLDGDLDVTLRLAAGIGARLDVAADAGASASARGLWTSKTAQRATLRLCGSRRVRIRVTAPAGTRFSIGVTKP